MKFKDLQYGEKFILNSDLKFHSGAPLHQKISFVKEDGAVQKNVHWFVPVAKEFVPMNCLTVHGAQFFNLSDDTEVIKVV